MKIPNSKKKAPMKEPCRNCGHDRNLHTMGAGTEPCRKEHPPCYCPDWEEMTVPEKNLWDITQKLSERVDDLEKELGCINEDQARRRDED